MWDIWSSSCEMTKAHHVRWLKLIMWDDWSSSCEMTEAQHMRWLNLIMYDDRRSSQEKPETYHVRWSRELKITKAHRWRWISYKILQLFKRENVKNNKISTSPIGICIYYAVIYYQKRKNGPFTWHVHLCVWGIPTYVRECTDRLSEVCRAGFG